MQVDVEYAVFKLEGGHDTGVAVTLRQAHTRFFESRRAAEKAIEDLLHEDEKQNRYHRYVILKVFLHCLSHTLMC